MAMTIAVMSNSIFPQLPASHKVAMALHPVVVCIPSTGTLTVKHFSSSAQTLILVAP